MGISVGTLKNCGRFLIGDWTEPVGRMCYQARKNKTTPTSMFSFGWKDACKDYWAGADKVKTLQPQLADAISKAGEGLTGAAKTTAIRKAGVEFAKNATNGITSKVETKAIRDMVSKTIKSETKNPGFFSKIGNFLGKIPGMKFIGKNIFPIMIAVQTVSAAISGYKDGGIGGALKEATRGLLKMGGYILAFAGIAALGFTGIGAMIGACLISSFVLDKGIDFVLGKTPEEKQELAQQAVEQQQQAAFVDTSNPFVMAANKNSGRSLTSFGGTNKLPDMKNFEKTLDGILGPAQAAMSNRHNYYC